MSETLLEQLETVRRQRATARRRRFTRSRLDKHRAELETLAAEGASCRDLALWLRQYKRIKVHPSTVWRRLTYWADTDRN